MGRSVLHQLAARLDRRRVRRVEQRAKRRSAAIARADRRGREPQRWSRIVGRVAVSGVIVAAVIAAVAAPIAVVQVTNAQRLEHADPTNQRSISPRLTLEQQWLQDTAWFASGQTADPEKESMYLVRDTRTGVRYGFSQMLDARRFADEEGVESVRGEITGLWDGQMVTDPELGNGRPAFVVFVDEDPIFVSPALKKLDGGDLSWMQSYSRESGGPPWMHPPDAAPLMMTCFGAIPTIEWKFGEGLLADVERPTSDGADVCYFRTDAQVEAASRRIVTHAVTATAGIVGGAGVVTMVITGGLSLAVDRYRRRLQQVSRADVPALMHDPNPAGLFGGITEEVNHSLSRARMSVEQQRSFVADAAHELRSPLTSLITTLEVADRHPTLVDPRQVTRTSLTQARRLERLTQDLLLLAQLDARTRLRDDVVDLADVLREVIADTPDQGRPITIAGIDRTPVIGDRDAFRRVLRNLVDNAVRHAAKGVEVTLTSKDGLARLQVANDGTPIPDDQIERIFERFTRLDQSRGRGSGGSGLGLAIARGLAERYGGTLELLPGRIDGATFVWEVPVAR